MQIKPVPQIEAPAYPTQDELLADRKATEDCLPRRWRKTKGLAGALSLLVAANMTGCGDGGAGQPRPPSASGDGPDVVVQSSYWIRSIFRERQVMLGCIAMMPPAVLQEDAAAHGAGLVGKQPPAGRTPSALPPGEGVPGLPELPPEQAGPRNPWPQP